MNRDKRLEVIERGKASAITESIVRPLIEEQVDKKIHAMVNLYRNGGLTFELLVGSVGEISALYSLLSTLEGDQRLAIGAADEEYNAKEAH